MARGFSSETELVSADLIEMHPEDLCGLFGLHERTYTDFTLKVCNPVDPDLIMRAGAGSVCEAGDYRVRKSVEGLTLEIAINRNPPGLGKNEIRID